MTVDLDFDGVIFRLPRGAADLEKAATIAVAGATGNSGQRCTAVKRILVQESVADRFVPMVLERAKALRHGDPMDPETQLGCVIHAKAAETFERRVYNAEKAGAKILYHPGRNGALLPAITVDHVPHESELVMEETFGAIVPIVRVPDNDAEVMRILENLNREHGVAVALVTHDHEIAARADRQVAMRDGLIESDVRASGERTSS